MLEDMRGLLQAAEEKRQAALAELSAKHQKVHELQHFWLTVFIVYLLGGHHIFVYSFIPLRISFTELKVIFYIICTVYLESSCALASTQCLFLQNIQSLEAQLNDALFDKSKAFFFHNRDDYVQVNWSYTYTRPSYTRKQHHSIPKDWWTEDVSDLNIDLFRCILMAIKFSGLVLLVTFSY